MADLHALRSGYLGSLATGDDTHLTEAQWECLACDELGAEDRRDAMDHIIGCPLCSDTYRALQIIRNEAVEFDETVPVPRTAPEDTAVRGIPWRGLGLLAMAAVVTLVVILPIYRAWGPSVADSSVVLRGAEAEPIAVPLSPKGSVTWPSGSDLAMSWTTDMASSTVVVEILDADGELIWTSPETTEVETVWPGTEIPGTGRYYWRVVMDGGSAGDASSELVSFDLDGAGLNANHP